MAAAHHIYHWKHGWIPLDHYAALKKSKGSDAGARRYLDAAHRAGHAHESVRGGSYGGGTHVRGLQPVSREHLPRESHVTAAFNPDTRRFALHSTQGNHGVPAKDGETKPDITTSIPEHLAEHLHRRGHTVVGISNTEAGNHVIVRSKDGRTIAFRSDGGDIGRVDPEVIDAPKPRAKPTPKASPPAAAPGADSYVATHTVDTRSLGGRPYGVIKPINGYGGTDVISHGLAEKIKGDDGAKVIGYERRVLTVVGSDGVVRRYKADGSNIDKPTIAKPAAVKAAKDIGEWKALPVADALPETTAGKPITSHKVQRAYRQGNKTVLIETKVTEAEATAFLAHVKQAFDATGDATGHAVTVHVPAGDTNFRTTRRGTVLGYVYSGDATRVHINPSVLKDSSNPTHSRPGDSGHFMGAHFGVHPTVYTLTHELGHIVDNHQQHTARQTMRTPSGLSIPLGRPEGADELHRQQRDNLSGYGKKNAVEGYAEAFAHHHLKERGNNPTNVILGAGTRAQVEANDQAAAAYAEKYGWKAAPGGIAKASDSVIRIAARGGDASAIKEARRRGLPV